MATPGNELHSWINGVGGMAELRLYLLITLKYFHKTSSFLSSASRRLCVALNESSTYSESC